MTEILQVFYNLFVLSAMVAMGLSPRVEQILDPLRTLRTVCNVSLMLRALLANFVLVNFVLVPLALGLIRLPFGAARPGLSRSEGAYGEA